MEGVALDLLPRAALRSHSTPGPKQNEPCGARVVAVVKILWSCREETGAKLCNLVSPQKYELLIQQLSFQGGKSVLGDNWSFMDLLPEGESGSAVWF